MKNHSAGICRMWVNHVKGHSVAATLHCARASSKQLTAGAVDHKREQILIAKLQLRLPESTFDVACSTFSGHLAGSKTTLSLRAAAATVHGASGRTCSLDDANALHHDTCVFPRLNVAALLRLPPLKCLSVIPMLIRTLALTGVQQGAWHQALVAALVCL